MHQNLKYFIMLYEYDGTEEKCPLPLVKMRVILKKMQFGDTLTIKISDKGSMKDIPKLLTKQGYSFSQRYLNESTVKAPILQLHISLKENTNND
jgi:tRNA 2-thiouridine synthesizing protein A